MNGKEILQPVTCKWRIYVGNAGSYTNVNGTITYYSRNSSIFENGKKICYRKNSAIVVKGNNLLL